MTDFYDMAISSFKEKFGSLTLAQWCVKHIRLSIKGELVPFSFADHEYLMELYELPVDLPRVSIQKAAQMGISIWSLLRSFYFMDRRSVKVGYYFPTDEDVMDFSQDRANTIIDNSDYLCSKMSYDRADNLGLKQMGSSSLYFRGVWTKRKVKSIDLDMIIKDEVDEADQENLVFAEDRLLHSAFGYIIELSQPSRPDFGINRSFKKSDQRHRLLKCDKCGKWNDIVSAWPGNMVTKGKGENLTAYIACTRCRRRLNPKMSKWVAKYPARSKEHTGFLISQLFGPAVDITHIYKKWAGATLISEKKNVAISLIGVPYSDPELCPFTDELLTGLEKKGFGFERSAMNSFMGIDVGDLCHVTIWGWTGNRLRLIWLEEIPSDNFNAFCALIEKYRSFFVIDAMPYKNLSKRLCLRYPGWGAIQYFKGDALKEGLEGSGEYQVQTVKHDRTESIDEMAGLFNDEFFLLPDPKKLKSDELNIYEKWKEQLKNLEAEQIDDKSGYKIKRYKKNVANHFGMATNSALIAFRIGKGYYQPSAMPYFGN